MEANLLNKIRVINYLMKQTFPHTMIFILSIERIINFTKRAQPLITWRTFPYVNRGGDHTICHDILKLFNELY